MHLRRVAILTVLLSVGMLVAAPSSAAPDEAPPDGTEMQARGPVHEAYGEPTRPDPAPGVLASQEPPSPIEESPPDNKPEGDNVVWIPGYWAWDAEESEYVWISGFWRAVPPGRAWLPGNWQKSAEGYRWVSGYWGLPAADDSEEPGEVEYLPEPPKSLDRGPTVPAPDKTSTYVPGCWIWSDTSYLWRPGHWVDHRPGWVWVSACYRWTPGGFIFVPGYWDLPLLERGLLFAPVRFARPVWRTAGFVYRPTYVVQPDFLCGALFVATDAPCYYFGDYFTVGHRQRLVPWMSYRPHRRTWDVNFAYYRHAYAGNRGWERSLNTLYANRYDGVVPRPPRNLVQQTTVINQINVNKTTNVVVNKDINITNVQNVSVLTPISKATNVHVTALSALAGPMPAGAAVPTRQVKIEKVTRERLVEEQKSAARIRALSQQRLMAESKLAAQGLKAESRKAPVTVKLDLPKGTPPARVVRSPAKAPAPPSPAASDAKRARPGKSPAEKSATPLAKQETKSPAAKVDRKPDHPAESKAMPASKSDTKGKVDNRPDTKAKVDSKSDAPAVKPGKKRDAPPESKAKPAKPPARPDAKGKGGKKPDAPTTSKAKPAPKPVPAPPPKDRSKDAKDND